MTREKVNLSLQISPETFRKLEQHAINKQKHKTTVMREAINRYLDKREKCTDDATCTNGYEDTL